MRVVLSLGGSVLAPELAADRIAAHAAVIEELADEGCRLGVVVGGGGVAREYIGVARELEAGEVSLDGLGIAATRLNARLLATALDDAPAAPAASYEEAAATVRRGEIALMGGVSPGQTTDAVAAVLAESVDADLLVYGTNADGVYDADPAENADATKFDRLTPTELVDVIAPLDRGAGASAPVDLPAATLLERSGTRAVVLDATDPDAVRHAVLDGDHTGTDVVPAGGGDPTYWSGGPAARGGDRT